MNPLIEPWIIPDDTTRITRPILLQHTGLKFVIKLMLPKVSIGEIDLCTLRCYEVPQSTEAAEGFG